MRQPLFKFLVGILVLLGCSTWGDVLWTTSEVYRVSSGEFPSGKIINPGIVFDNSSTGTVYFGVTIYPSADHTDELYFGGFQFFHSGVEKFSVGNAFDPYAWSAFDGVGLNLDLNSANSESGEVWQLVQRQEAVRVVGKIEYVPSANDDITIWLDPVSTNEIDQPTNLTTQISSDASFDEIRLRIGNDDSLFWVFEEVYLATSFEDALAHREEPLPYIKSSEYDVSTGEFVATVTNNVADSNYFYRLEMSQSLTNEFWTPQTNHIQFATNHNFILSSDLVSPNIDQAYFKLSEVQYLAWEVESSTNILAVMSAHNGESICWLNSTGLVFSFTSKFGDSAIFYVDDEGLPSKIYDNGFMVVFDNYTETTVDFVVIHPDGSQHLYENVSIDSNLVARTKVAAQAFNAGDQIAPSLASIEDWQIALEIASYATSIAGCAISIATGAVPAALLACGSAIYSTGVYFDWWDEVPLVETAEGFDGAWHCALFAGTILQKKLEFSSALECFSFAADHILQYLATGELHQEVNSEWIEQAYSYLSSHQTYFVPGAGNAVSSAILEPGITYSIKVSGTYTRPHPADAFFIHFGSWSSSCNSGLSRLVFNLTSWCPTTFSGNHVYETTIVGTGAPLVMNITDTFHGDNAGGVYVEINRQ